jgi:hypothetical protein
MGIYRAQAGTCQPKGSHGLHQLIQHPASRPSPPHQAQAASQSPTECLCMSDNDNVSDFLSVHQVDSAGQRQCMYCGMDTIPCTASQLLANPAAGTYTQPRVMDGIVSAPGTKQMPRILARTAPNLHAPPELAYRCTSLCQALGIATDELHNT